ncbi:elongation factor P maturation arginine rhamnosyltransferase EarP [Aquabacterium sp.]|uniref:elongation factor P maturation arginine rhamnosyltransferase EarP n=1 Tax=Aquabacterium sp. TaxID=1872578 RepID=UPI0025BBC5C6|nr:elongation factor P maturation arginine rhamnosyltransferase EarP [Aquabacterium sp.]
MLWDVFCRVIDNFGDIGVCWRLCTDLGARGHTARLWVDDASALAWMAPQGARGVEVRAWAEAESPEAAAAITPGDVVIEAFGCNPPDAFLARMQRPQPPAWVNLEYLSAEDYVERSHGLTSPVFSGPAAGLRKRFFYPGFTPATGGLLREPGLMARQADFAAHQRVPWLHRLGVPASEADRLVSVFCYAGAPLGDWLDALQAEALQAACDAPADTGTGTATSPAGMTRVLLTPGHATSLAQAWAAQGRHTAPQALALHPLPALPQTEFDLLLWACHLNIVRGEDSAVRALWAGRPHVWHIYQQDDGVHADKLDAFIARWMQGWPAALRDEVQRCWRHFNQIPAEFGAALAATAMATPAPCPRLADWRNANGAWAQASRDARAAWLAQTDLVTQLTHFVAGSG